MRNSIPVNIWDDYYDDGYVPEGDIQKTYAYVESQDFSEDDCKAILGLLKNEIEQIAKPEWNLKLDVEFYDSAKVYPNLVGTEHEFFLYKRWQLNMINISHEAREVIVDQFEKKTLSYNNMDIDVYSES